MTNTILIVDDMKLNIDILTEILGGSYTIMAAVSGENAIRLLEKKKPDLVLLDVAMPGIDGFEVLRFMRSRPELTQIPVIFVTGELNSQAEEKGLLLGAVDYIKKPFNATTIVVKVRNHLELKAYRDDLEGLVRERTKQLTASRDAIIMGMSFMSERHDSVTGEHIIRIKSFTKLLAEKTIEVYPGFLSPELAEHTVLFSPLHDIGKISISDVILNKTGVLNPAEFHIMQSHTLEGASLLRQTEHFLVSGDVSSLNVAIEIAECHHEHYDGTGYPHGYMGDEIPLPARVVSIADIYDALRSPRSYKQAFSHEEAVGIIMSGDGRVEPDHFDPTLLSVFAANHMEFDRLYAPARSN